MFENKLGFPEVCNLTREINSLINDSIVARQSFAEKRLTAISQPSSEIAKGRLATILQGNPGRDGESLGRVGVKSNMKDATKLLE